MKVTTELWADGKETNRAEVTNADSTPNIREKNTQRNSKHRENWDDKSKDIETNKASSIFTGRITKCALEGIALTHDARPESN